MYFDSLLVDDDFIYEDEEEEEPDVDVENGYYNAKGEPRLFSYNLPPALKEEDPKAALDEFRTVVETETAAGEKGDWYLLVHLHK